MMARAPPSGASVSFVISKCDCFECSNDDGATLVDDHDIEVWRGGRIREGISGPVTEPDGWAARAGLNPLYRASSRVRKPRRSGASLGVKPLWLPD